MNSRVKSEFLVWLRVVVVFFVCISLAMIFIELVIGPTLRAILYDEPYSFPSLAHLASTVITVLLISCCVGTIIWFARRRMSGH